MFFKRSTVNLGNWMFSRNVRFEKETFESYSCKKETCDAYWCEKETCDTYRCEKETFDTSWCERKNVGQLYCSEKTRLSRTKRTGAFLDSRKKYLTAQMLWDTRSIYTCVCIYTYIYTFGPSIITYIHIYIYDIHILCMII